MVCSASSTRSSRSWRASRSRYSCSGVRQPQRKKKNSMFDLDPLVLARLQFAFTVSFHIVFPTISIGLALFLAIVEALWLRTGDLVYRQIYRFWLNIFAMSFAISVVTGVVMSFQFGLTFARFSQFAGSVIGPLIAYETLTAFFLEAGFLGIMLFGENRVGPKLHFFA